MHIRIKICGITNLADAEQAAELGADLIGLNFYAKSPRRIDEATATAIVKSLPVQVTPVALYVNEPVVEIKRHVQALNVRIVQFHGDHPGLLPTGMNWILAFAVQEERQLHAITTYLESLRAAGTPPFALLIDAHVPGMFGGTGQVAPWHLLADSQPGVPVILAGGLTPENVGDAIRIVRPYAVDVASGVESSPGKKDVDKMRRFIAAVRDAST